MASAKVDLGGSGVFVSRMTSLPCVSPKGFAVLLPFGVLRLTVGFLALSVLLLAAELEES